jgi:hypothetical protein
MKFTTTLEAVSSNKSKTTIKLSLSNAEARKFTAQYLNSIDKELIVTFDDPQMEMDLQPAPNGRPGIVATINGQGVVESAERPDEPEDDHADLFAQDEDTGEESEDDDGDADEEADHEPAAENDVEHVDGHIDPDELERYILAVRPAWDDIPYDFPSLIERKKAEGLKWHELAREYKIPSTKLQAAYGKYKERCKQQILNGAA